MQQEDFDHALKVVVVGNGNVGKSSLIRKFCRNEYVPTYKKTIGVDYQERELVVKMSDKDDHDETEERKVRIMVWDCAGQEDFDQITRDYYTGMPSFFGFDVSKRFCRR
jgi:Ras-related protein Rab-23